MAAFIDLTGQKFGMLTVIDRGPNRGGRSAWNCICDCGEKAHVQSNNLRSGNSKSCGCQIKRGKELQDISAAVRLERSKEELIGKRFGSLVIIEHYGTHVFNSPSRRNSTTRWLAKCDCGTVKDYKRSALVSGHTRSCGCIQSHGERIIAEYLTDQNISFKKEITFNDLLGIGGGHLRYDFGIYDNKENLLYIIEYDGAQHYTKSDNFYKDSTVVHDKLKDKYAIDNNIKLVRLRYQDLENLQEVFDSL